MTDNKQEDMGIMNYGGTLYFHHDWIKQHVSQKMILKEVMEQIAFNQNLNIEEIRKIAWDSLDAIIPRDED